MGAGFGKAQNSVFIIDSQIENLELLGDMLENEYTVYKEVNGDDVIKSVKQEEPDLILLGVHMTGLSSADIMTTLKESDKTKNIPIITLLDDNSLGDVKEYFLLGAIDYIQKPFHPVVVKARVRNYINLVNQQHLIDQLDGIDTLTNLFNSSFFQIRLDQEWLRAMRDNTQISTFVIGIDNFTGFDEQYGKERSDDVIKCVAEIIKNNLKRSMDILARWEDDVFVVLLPNTREYGAAILAEIIRKAIENSFVLQRKLEDSIVITVTIVSGCCKPEKGNISKDFLSHTMETFFNLRKTGKNIVHTIV
ncbi:MAG: diguanylate cyclase [Defluviitaleaceae bacterium]|nr:diguanylate cyclase [Defluviitaleaceae bacterium]